MNAHPRLRAWLDWLLCVGGLRPRPPGQRLESENAHRARAAIADHFESHLNLCQDELEMLWGRHREKHDADTRPHA